jgi:hypothetical protein
MNALKLKDGSYISTTCSNRASLDGSTTDAPDGTHELEDGTKIRVLKGKVISVVHATNTRTITHQISAVQMKMKRTG